MGRSAAGSAGDAAQLVVGMPKCTVAEGGVSPAWGVKRGGAEGVKERRASVVRVVSFFEG